MAEPKLGRLLGAALHDLHGPLNIEEPALLEKFDWDAFPRDILLLADSLCVYRVLVNLLSNAHRYGGPQVRVAARVVGIKSTEGMPVCSLTLQYARAALVSVSDDGAGVAPESRPHLFRPFWRPPGPQEPLRQGLGLWLARQLVQAHGGELWLDADSASLFYALWPLHGERPQHRASRPLDRDEQLDPSLTPCIEIPPHTPLAGAERLVILETLRQCRGNKQIAALFLGISRRALYDKLRRYGI